MLAHNLVTISIWFVEFQQLPFWLNKKQKIHGPMNELKFL